MEIKYFELKEAIKELKRRQENEDQKLIKNIDVVLGNCPIPFGPYGFLDEHIATCGIEDELFAKRCIEAGIKPLWLENSRDRFYSLNPYKMRLIRIRVNDGKKCEHNFVEYLVEKSEIKFLEGKKLNEIRTKKGESLVDFHHAVREILKGWNSEETILDMSDWLKNHGNAKMYYKYFLLATVTRGILFKSYENPGFPEEFLKEVVIPAYRWVRQNFFRLPLIVKHPLANSKSEEEKILNLYPKEILSLL